MSQLVRIGASQLDHKQLEQRRIDTLTLLQRYKTSDLRERAFQSRMVALLGVKGDPFHRSWTVPGHFTASAFVLSPDGQQLLLIHHRKLQRWLQPGGHFEPLDVSVDAAIRREVVEETGISALQPAVQTTTDDGASQALFDVDIHLIPAHGDAAAHAHFDLRMAYRAESWDLHNCDEVDDVRWVPLTEVAQMETDASVLRAVKRLIDHLHRGAIVGHS